MTLELTSTALAHGGEIPSKYTCDGQDVSPPLAWSGVPAEAKSLVLIIDDPDAPDPAAPKMTWVHWVLYNMPPSASALPEGARQLPAGTLEGVNDWKRTGYSGPCPSAGTATSTSCTRSTSYCPISAGRQRRSLRHRSRATSLRRLSSWGPTRSASECNAATHSTCRRVHLTLAPQPLDARLPPAEHRHQGGIAQEGPQGILAERGRRRR